MTTSFIYITTGNKVEAESIGRVLVEERLVACVNIIDGMTSMYWWEGKLESAQEAVLIAKSTEDRIEAVIARVKSLHSYACPCVVAWPITRGNPDYLQWIHDETHGAQ